MNAHTKITANLSIHRQPGNPRSQKAFYSSQAQMPGDLKATPLFFLTRSAGCGWIPTQHNFILYR